MTEQEVNNLIDSKIGKVKMSQLPETDKTGGLYSIGYIGNQSVKYKANLLQGDPLTVRKTYQTEALALADKNPIDPTTSLLLKVGQFVSIVDDGEKNGIYRISSISGDGTMSLELQGKLGDLSEYAKLNDLDNLKNSAFTYNASPDGESYDRLIDALLEVPVEVWKPYLILTALINGNIESYRYSKIDINSSDFRNILNWEKLSFTPLVVSDFLDVTVPNRKKGVLILKDGKLMQYIGNGSTNTDFTASFNWNTFALIKDLKSTKKEIEGKYFTEEGYAHGGNGNIVAHTSFTNTGMLAIGDAELIKVAGSNSASASVLNFYNEKGEFISRATTEERAAYSWTFDDFPDGAFFIIATARKDDDNKSLEFDTLAGINKGIAKLHNKINAIPDISSLSSLYVNNFESDVNGFEKINSLGIYKTNFKASNKKLRIAFNFRFNKDINVGELAKVPIMTLKGTHSSSGEIFLKANLRSQATSLLTTNENRYTEEGKTIMTTYPIPKFNTGFGWETDAPNTPGDRRIYDYDSRNYPDKKPLAGIDSFRIQYKGLLKNDPSKNVDDVDVQSNLLENQDWKITISDSALTIYKSDISEVFDFIAYPTISELLGAIREKTEDGETLEFFEVESYDTGSSNILNYGPAYPSSSLLRVTDIPFISEYPSMTYSSQDATTTRRDAFSFYAQFGHDRSEHTFELVIDDSENGGLMNIDGQFARYASGEGPFNGSANLQGIQRILDGGDVSIIIGGDENSTESIITPYNLLIETENFTDCEFTLVSGRIASWYTPFIAATGGHAIYEGENIGTDPTGYDDGTPPGSAGPLHVVPAKYKSPRSQYIGDDHIPINKLTSATENYVRFINEVKTRGYVNVTLNQLKDWFNGNGKLPHYKCYYLQVDDYRTYAFDDIDIRKAFTTSGTKMTFSLELSKYVDEDYTPFEGGKSGTQWMSEHNDTNAHRLKLQKRINQMQLMQWECVSHGEDGNTYTGRSSKEVERIARESVRMCDYLGVHGDIMTWAASQYTINSVKVFEHMGMSFISRSGGEYPSLADNRFCVSRLYFDHLNWQNLLTKII